MGRCDHPLSGPMDLNWVVFLLVSYPFLETRVAGTTVEGEFDYGGYD